MYDNCDICGKKDLLKICDGYNYHCLDCHQKHSVLVVKPDEQEKS